MHAGAPADPILKMSAQDLTCDLDLSHDEVGYLLDLADAVKASPKRFGNALAGRSLSLLFEKPSLRTRMTFELAIKQMGGDSVFSNGPIGDREPLKDVARNLDRWTDGIVARTFSQKTVLELARWSSVPVINALSDLYHPCQALADIMTLRERFGDPARLEGGVRGRRQQRGAFVDALSGAVRSGCCRRHAPRVTGRTRTWWGRPRDWPRRRDRA